MISGHKQSGFTLIEILVYLAIFLVVAVSAVGFLLSLDTFLREYRVETALYQSSTDVLENVQLALRQAEALDTLNSATGTTNGVLAVTGASSTEIARSGGDIILTIDGVTVGSLLASEVTVTDFTVFHYPMSIGEVVRVQVGLSATLGSTTKSVQLQTGSVVRNSI